MKKKLSLLLTAVVMILVLTACGSRTSEDVSVDVTKLCEDLQGTITSELAVISSDNLASTYFLDMAKVEESTAALGSAASACEVAVVKCKDSSYVSEVKTLFEDRVKYQSEQFADYNPPEVAKLNSALIKTAGNYAVLCVTDDTAKAEEILKEAGF